MASEQDFLRSKTTTVYESTHTVISAEGEILRREQSSKKHTSSEPDYIKLYYRAMMAVQDIDEVPLSFLLALSGILGYANGEELLFYNNKTTRRIIADACSIGDNMVAKYIRRCVQKGILFTTSDRGTYTVNPWLIAKGRWEHIKELQASFRFVEGRWERVVDLEEPDDEGTD